MKLKPHRQTVSLPNPLQWFVRWHTQATKSMKKVSTWLPKRVVSSENRLENRRTEKSSSLQKMTN